MHSAQIRRLGETLLIVAIVGILGGVWLFKSEEYVSTAQEAQAQQQIYSIGQALRAYRFENGEYPPVVHNLRFCEPFRMYQGQLCLWQLLDSYITIENISFGKVTYIYAPSGEAVVLAADIPVGEETPPANRCKIGEILFWCVTLPK